MSTTNDRLVEQAKEVAKDVKQMGEIVRDAAQDKLGQLHANASDHCELQKDRLVSIERSAEQYLRQRPFQSVLIAAGFGLLVGRFWMRR
jgi:ElaB/YqjD/DUF883 family membrane-anchored ribosome-binding protein